MTDKVVIGNATLYLGDCLEILPTLDKVDAVVTDPPYGVSGNSWDSVIPLDQLWPLLKSIVDDASPIVMTASQPFTSTLILSNLKAFRYEWIWHKSRPTGWLQCDFMPMKEHENICVFTFNGKPTFNVQKKTGHKPTNAARGLGHGEGYGNMTERNYAGGDTTRNPTSILKFKSERGLHPTQKPLGLMEYMVKTYSNKGDVVLDFAMGSGTTGEACINLKRDFIGIEIVPKYFDISCERIENAQRQQTLF